MSLSDEFARAYRYKRTFPFSRIRDISQDAEPQGACGTFAWSVLSLETGGHPWRAILTGRALLWRCKSPSNGTIPRHAVLYFRGKWIDSTVREWRETPAPHKLRWPMGAPLLTIIAALLFASPLRAQDAHAWGSAKYPSTIQLQPTTAPGAVAQVSFDNKTVHRDERVTFDLTMGDLTVTVEALVGRGLTPDTFTVTPPPGYFAVPESMDVAEDDVGVILLVPFLGY